MCRLCESASIDQVTHELQQRIEQNGFTMIGVENTDSPYAYTVGLHTHGLQELYLPNTHPAIAEGILSVLARRHMSRPLRVDEVVEITKFRSSYRIDYMGSTAPLKVVNLLYGTTDPKPAGFRIVPLEDTTLPAIDDAALAAFITQSFSTVGLGNK